jgi:hypothetical protein
LTVDDEVITLPEELYRRFQIQEIGWLAEDKIEDNHAFLDYVLWERDSSDSNSFRRVDNYAFRIPLCWIQAARDINYRGVFDLIIERARNSGGKMQYFWVLSRSYRSFADEASTKRMTDEEVDKIIDERRYGLFTGRCSFASLLRFTEDNPQTPSRLCPFCEKGDRSITIGRS